MFSFVLEKCECVTCLFGMHGVRVIELCVMGCKRGILLYVYRVWADGAGGAFSGHTSGVSSFADKSFAFY